MKMKALLMGLIGLTAVSTAQAVPTITYTLSLNDNGTHVLTPNSFAVYATVSSGDNAGLLAFTFTLTGQTGNATNVSPNASFINTTTGATKTTGFSQYHFDGASGQAITGSFDSIVNNGTGSGIPYYGIGQNAAGDLKTAAPVGTISFSPNTTYLNPVLLATGTFTGSTASPPVQITTSGANSPVAGNVFLSTSTGFQSLAADPVFQTTNLASTPEPASLAVLGLGGVSVFARRRKSA